MADREHRGGCLGRLIALLLVLAIVVGAVGWWRDWFGFSVSPHEESEKVDVKVTVDPEKIKQDTTELASETRKLTESVKSLGADSVEGTIQSLDREANQLVVTAEDGDLDFQINNQTEGLGGLEQGQRVSVTFAETDGVKTATKVTLLTDETE